MPIYEYACGDCGNQFEALVRAGATPACPACQSQALAKKISAPAATGLAAAHNHAGPCGSCGHPSGPGSCALN